jgi:hypothetical protein
MRTILSGCAALLRPDGVVAMTVRPGWRDGQLIDLPGALVRVGEEAGLVLYERNVALLAGLRGDQLVPRTSFFSLEAVRKARQRGVPRLAVAHEDFLVFKSPAEVRVDGQPTLTSHRCFGRSVRGVWATSPRTRLLTDPRCGLAEGLDLPAGLWPPPEGHESNTSE